MVDNPTLQREFNYYKQHQKELVEQYSGKFLVIKDDIVQGAYNTEIEAYQEAQKKYELGTFLIQFVTPGEASYTQTFYSRVGI